jgi:hypothetical protein
MRRDDEPHGRACSGTLRSAAFGVGDQPKINLAIGRRCRSARWGRCYDKHLTESVVEDAAVGWLRGIGWSLRHGIEVALGESGAGRTDYAQSCWKRGRRAACRRVPEQATRRKYPIPDAGGLRKLRFADARRGKGKRGGLRVIYYFKGEIGSRSSV